MSDFRSFARASSPSQAALGPLVIGHRGVRGEAPENTMAAFSLAADQGADGVELDVRLAASGEVVVCHDPSLSRITNGLDERNVVDLPWEKLRLVDVGGGEPMPTLDAVLYWAEQRGIGINIELKRDVPDRDRLVHETHSRICAAHPSVPILVSSFDPWMLAALGRMQPSIATALLVHPSYYQRIAVRVPRLLKTHAINVHTSLIQSHSLRRWREARMVNAWTVNDPIEAISLGHMGVDGIITDTPRRVLQALGR